MAHQLTVTTLIEEETRLLTLLPIYEELLAILLYDVRLMVGVAPDISIDCIQPRLEGYGLRTLVVDSLQSLSISRTQSLSNGHTRKIHTHRVALHHSRAIVDIDNESRQRITFAVNKAVAVGLGIIGKVERATHIVGNSNTSIPPILVDLFLLLKGQHTNGYGANLIVAASDKIT